MGLSGVGRDSGLMRVAGLLPSFGSQFSSVNSGHTRGLYRRSLTLVMNMGPIHIT